MPVTVKVNRLSLVHRVSQGATTATLPDVCKTPPGPVPVPYPNISFSKDLANGTKTVFADGGNMISLRWSKFDKSIGDEPGVAGGVKSGTNMKEAKWLSYSFDVKIEGGNATRFTDKMTCNHANTVCMSGIIQPNPMDQPPPDPVCAAIYALIQAAIWTQRTMSGMGLQGLAARWTEAAINRGGWTAAENATHAKAYREQASGLKRQIRAWDRNQCDGKGGGGLPQIAREYATQEPVLGSGTLVPTVSAITATDVAVGTAGVAAGVGAGYLIYRGIRMIPSLFPPLWWTIPNNLAFP